MTAKKNTTPRKPYDLCTRCSRKVVKGVVEYIHCYVQQMYGPLPTRACHDHAR